MIKINDIPQITCYLYDSDGYKLGIITSEYSFNDVRCQIKEQNLSGYFVMFKGHRIDIDSDGSVSNWPYGFYDITEKQIEILFSPKKEL